MCAPLTRPPTAVQPPSRTTALVSSLSNPSSTDLNDLSISRPASRLSWGIPVPDDPQHTIYVWIDALVNYLTAAGYPWLGGEAFEKGKVWPPDLQVVGKDIVRCVALPSSISTVTLLTVTRRRFHALYLPAVLLALDLPLPKHLLTHGHWTMDKFKMSKSRGNVANPFEAMQLWGVDAMRMYLMRVGGNSASDAGALALVLRVRLSVSLMVNVQTTRRARLSGSIARTSPARWATCSTASRPRSSPRSSSHPSSCAPCRRRSRRRTRHWSSSSKTCPVRISSSGSRTCGSPCPAAPAAAFDGHLASFDVHRALSAVFDALAESNRHVQLLSPWLATASPSDVHRALFFGSETLRIAGILLQPFMPTKAAQLLDMLGVDAARRRWEDCEIGKGGHRTAPAAGKVHLWPAVVVPEAAAS